MVDDPGSRVARIQGFHAVKHAVRFDATIADVFVVDRRAAMDLAHRLAPDLASRIEEATVVSADRFRSVMGSDHPTGVGAIAFRPPDVEPEQLLDSSLKPFVFLEDPRRLGNVGAIVRTIAGLGGGGLLTSGAADPWHEEAVRGSAGLHFAVVVQHISELPDVGERLIAFDAGGQDIRTVEVPDNAVLAFGTERDGISTELRSRAAQVVALPLEPRVSSYNLAASVTMALFKWANR